MTRQHYGNGIWYEPTLWMRVRDWIDDLADASREARRSEEQYHALLHAEAAAYARAHPAPVGLDGRPRIRVLDWRLK